MSDKVQGGIVAGSTSVSIPFALFKTADGTEQTGKVAADMTASYWRQGGSRVAITLSDLGAIDAAYSSGGVKELDATNDPGTYRLDPPDAAVATGADWVEIAIKVAGCFVAKERYGLESVGSKANSTTLAAVKAKTDNLPSALVKNAGVTVTFELRSSSTPANLATGLSPSVLVSKDGGAFVAGSNTPAEISGRGVYSLALTAAEMNADVVTLLFMAAGAYTYSRTIFTKAA